MALLLSDEQRNALNEVRDFGSVEVIDPITKQSYVLVRSDLFRQFLESRGDIDPRVAYPLIDRVMANDDAHDPYLAEYQDEGSSN